MAAAMECTCGGGGHGVEKTDVLITVRGLSLFEQVDE